MQINSANSSVNSQLHTGKIKAPADTTSTTQAAATDSQDTVTLSPEALAAAQAETQGNGWGDEPPAPTPQGNGWGDEPK
jgi:anti-sigma28 factor (negative regulator of flagellin synthesis)